MSSITQEANATSGPGQPLSAFIPVVTIDGRFIPGSGWYPNPTVRTFGFVFQNAAPAASNFTIIPALAGAFIFVKLVLMRISAAQEIRLQFGGVTYFDYDFTAGQVLLLDFGTPGLTNASPNTAFTVTNPFGITDIRVNAWGSYSSQ